MTVAAGDGITLRPYTPADEAVWNRWVAGAANGSFLFDRGFMGYHADRFPDASLLIERQGRLLAVLPAHRDGDGWASHRGLSYGGLVVAQPLGPEATLAVLRAVQAHGRRQGWPALLYKTVPLIYHRLPCEDDRWALWRLGATLVRRDALAAIGPTAAHWPPARRRPITRAMRERAALRLHWQAGDEAAASWPVFWGLLEAELQARHGQSPVHSLDEIRLLAGRFPAHIRLGLACQGAEVLAGAVLFEGPAACRLQYTATGDAGRRVAALDQLLEQAVAQAQAGGRWFDFGHSHEDQGRAVNAGLAFYKASFGASTVVHDHYVLPC
ncbi:hypothetical protein [Ideonella sp.]|uniref:hypothetical protein n=1 Tax=Ideonella sp. TaxID=1929293 RepID=UPI0035B4C7F6